jgi:hypothetical protein
MANISLSQFDEQIQEQKDALNAIKWRELQTGQIYTITNADFFFTQFGEACVITLSDNQKVWAPSGLAKRLKQDGEDCFPRYVRPNGLVQSKKNPSQTYHGFDLV